MENEETILADELNVNEETETEEDVLDESDVDVVPKSVYDKVLEQKEKAEGRYKSAMKKINTLKVEPQKQTTTDIDIDARIEQKFNMIQEQKDFIKEYGEEVFTEVQKIKEKYPTLTLEQAYKLSPVSTDQPSKETPESLSMGGRANPNAYNNSKVITLEQLVALDKTAYRNAKEKIAKGELTLKN